MRRVRERVNEARNQLHATREEDLERRMAEVARMRQNAVEREAALDRSARDLAQLQNEMEETLDHYLARVREGQQDWRLVGRLGRRLLDLAERHGAAVEETNGGR